jgi:Xaa-Pro aminopeptidase
MSTAYSRRRERLKELMQETWIDGLLLLSPLNVYYLTGAHLACSYLIVPEVSDEVALVLDPEKDDYEQKSGLKDIRPFRMHDPMGLMRRTLEEVGLSRGNLGVEKSFLTALRLEMISKALPPKLKIVDGDPLIERMRAVKDEKEIECIRRAAALADLGMAAAVGALREGVSEKEIGAEATHKMLMNGASSVLQPVYVASGSRSAMSHGFASGKQIEHRDIVAIDISVSYNGYFADLARTVSMDSPTAEQQEAYGHFLETQERAIRMIGPGVSMVEIRDFVYRDLQRRKFERFTLDEIVHGVGLRFYERPNFQYPHQKSGDPEVIETNMVLALSNVGPYFEDFGLRLEDTMVVTEDGVEILTRHEKSLTRAT